MSHYSDRWLLPDGVEEIAPAEAQRIEQLRRCLLDTYQLWGYQLVIPPLLEFLDSLLIGVGNDLDLLTVKVTDQLSGRTMGIRPDITPQTARMDAHSLSRDGVNRLCYADYVVHAKPQSPQAVRTPFYVGVELFGAASFDADIEVVSLLLESLNALESLGVAVDAAITLDIGHVVIYRALTEAAGFNGEQEAELFELLQTKATTDIEAWINRWVADRQMAAWLLALPTLSGDRCVLKRAAAQLAEAPAAVLNAIDELTTIADIISARYPRANLYFDLSELRGYHYHTGMVFAAYMPGFGDAIANGGRYDHIGEAFGRPRPATGFSINLTAIMPLLSEKKVAYGIYASVTDDVKQWQAIQALRRAGEVVVCRFPERLSTVGQSHHRQQAILEEPQGELVCDRELVLEAGEYTVKPRFHRGLN